MIDELAQRHKDEMKALEKKHEEERAEAEKIAREKAKLEEEAKKAEEAAKRAREAADNHGKKESK